MKVRPYTRADEPAVIRLLSASLGWLADEGHRDFFRWKHYDNPFGESPGWVAEEDGAIVGVRLFLRWEFLRDGRVLRAVRAVDTATHPDFRGRGIFRTLTLHGLGELEADGVEFVFNTPNDQSLPGYVKMGWREVGRLPVRVRPRSPLVLRKLLTARVPAELGSLLPPAGSLPVSVPDHHPPPSDERAGKLMSTNRSPAYLRWRFGYAPLAYRAIPLKGTAHSQLVYRLRRRGDAVEAVIADVIGEPSSHRMAPAARQLWKSGADYAVGLAPRATIPGSLPVPGLAPTLTARDLCGQAPGGPAGWLLALGDVELF